MDPIKLEHFRNLVSLTAADGKIQEVERVALSKIAFEQGIPLERMNVMLQRAHEYALIIPQNTHEREKQLMDMIEFAFVDGELAQAELELIYTVADKLGFTRQEVGNMMAEHNRKQDEA